MAIRSTSLISPTNTLLDTVLSGYKWDITNDPTISLGVTHGYIYIIGDPVGLNPVAAKAVLDFIAADLERFLPINFDSSSPGLSVNYVHPNASWSTADITFSPYNPNGWGPVLYPFLSSTTMGAAEFPNPLHFEFESSNPGVDVLLNEIYLSSQSLVPGGIGFSLIYHELGHALGLKHPFSLLNDFDNFEAYGLSRDPGSFITTMSYEDPSSTSVDGYGASFGFMALDVLALQHLYGKRQDFNTGNNVYDLSMYSSTYGDIWYTYYDCGGVDTVSCQEADESWIVNLSLGLSTSGSEKSGVWLLSNQSSLNSILGFTENFYENIIGSNYGDTLTGNSVANNIFGGTGNDTIDGKAGNDILNGGLGIDRLIGGAGNDTYYVDVTSDIVTETSSGGTSDKIYSSSSYTLGSSSYVEYLYLTASSAINATGNSLANVLTGNSANNILNGGAGADKLIGGLGSDKLYGGYDAVTDIFDFNSITESKVGSTLRDKIYNFVTGKDDIDLSGIDANSRLGSDQAFKFGGTTKIANGVWYEKSGSDLLVHADINGDKVSDMDIQLVGVSKIVATDFVL